MTPELEDLRLEALERACHALEDMLAREEWAEDAALAALKFAGPILRDWPASGGGTVPG